MGAPEEEMNNIVPALKIGKTNINKIITLVKTESIKQDKSVNAVVTTKSTFPFLSLTN
jgi:hypothetical protein